jgi:hypothetical protein
MHVGIKDMDHDYTTEIMRCIEFIVRQTKRGVAVPDVFTQATGSYGYSITLNAQRAIAKNLNK